MIAPCKDCQNRKVGCHSTCKDYLLFKDNQESVRKARKIDADNRAYVVRSIMRCSRKKR